MEETAHIVISWIRDVGANSTDIDITTETELIEYGVLDSLAILNLVSFLEEEFRLVVPIEEFVPENFKTPAAVATMVARLM